MKKPDTQITIQTLKSECYIGDLLNLDRTRIVNTALDKAVLSLELIGYLKNRPCEACVFHTDSGCSKFACVFDIFLRDDAYENN